MALGSTQPLTEMSTRSLSGERVKGGRRVRLTLPPSVSRLCRENPGTSTSHNPMVFDDLLQGWLIMARITGVMDFVRRPVFYKLENVNH
jgi:hypothetical protein